MAKKNALVVSGGGSKGAYAVGVLDYIWKKESKLKFDAFVGTSTGALISPFAAMGRIDDLIDIYSNTNTKDVVIQKKGNILKLSSIYDTTPLKNLINKHISNQDPDFLKLIPANGKFSSKEIYLLTTCLQTNKLTVFTNQDVTKSPLRDSKYYDVIQIQDAEHFKHAMLASANQPVLMPPVRINKDFSSLPQRQYVDGGLAEYAGIETAIDALCDDILTIYLSAEKENVPTDLYKTIFQVLGPTLGTLTGNVGKNDLRIPGLKNGTLKYLDQIKSKLKKNGVSDEVINKAFKPGNISKDPELKFLTQDPISMRMIRPDKSLEAGFFGLIFKPKDMQKIMRRGKADAKKYFESLNKSEAPWRVDPEPIIA